MEQPPFVFPNGFQEPWEVPARLGDRVEPLGGREVDGLRFEPGPVVAKPAPAREDHGERKEELKDGASVSLELVRRAEEVVDEPSDQDGLERQRDEPEEALYRVHVSSSRGLASDVSASRRRARRARGTRGSGGWLRDGVPESAGIGARTEEGEGGPLEDFDGADVLSGRVGDDLEDAGSSERMGDQSPNELRGEAEGTEGRHDGIADLDRTRIVWGTEVAARADENRTWPLGGTVDGVPGVPTGGVGTLEEQRAKEVHGGTVVLAGGPAGWNVDAEETLKGLNRLEVGLDQGGRRRDENESGRVNGLHGEDVRAVAQDSAISGERSESAASRVRPCCE